MQHSVICHYWPWTDLDIIKRFVQVTGVRQQQCEECCLSFTRKRAHGANVNNQNKSDLEFNYFTKLAWEVAGLGALHKT